MRVRGWVIAGLGLCAFAERAEAQSARVDRRGPLELPARAGEAVTVPFRVTNTSGAPATIEPSLALPAGWRATGGTARELAPGEAELRLVAVRVPSGAAAGRHVVRYSASSSADSAVLVVPERRGIAVEPVETSAMSIAGDEYAIRFRLSNRGNVAERLVLRAADDQGARLRADSSSILLPPASERVIAVRGTTERGAPATVRHQVTLHASSLSDSASGRVLLTVVARGGGGTRRRRLPAELAVRAADSLSAAGFSFSARGALDRAQRVRLDVLARTADPAGTPFARQDEYRVRLDAPGLSLRAGDDVYWLSRLTGPGRYGFGVGATARRGVLSAGGIVSRDRRGDGIGGMTGGFVRVGGRRARVGLTMLAPDSAPGRWTVEGASTLSPLLSIEVEAAPGEPNLPRALRASGHTRVLTYDVQHLRGADAGGYIGSADQDFATVVLRPAGQLTLSASARRGGDLRRPGDTIQTFSNSRSASIGWGSCLNVEYRETGGDTASRGDLRSVRGRLGIPVFRRAWLHPAYEAGTVVPLPGAAPAAFRVASLQSTVSTRGGASAWMVVQRREGASASSLAAREWSGAASVQVPVLAGTWVRVAAHARRPGGAPMDARVDLSLERTLGAGHRVTLRGLANAGIAGGWDRRGTMEYALPVAIPLPGRGEGQATVRVFDPVTGRGIPDVLVRLADRIAITDRRGIAGFAGLAVGSYTVRVDGGAGPERVANRDLPVPVTVDEDGGGRVEIGLELAARMTGLVERVPAAAGADSAAAPLAGVEVELSGSGGVRRAVTDAEGRFEATGLRPGWWRVTVVAASLPRHHEAPEHQMIFLAPGGAERVYLRVMEKVRPVQMIQSTELTLQ
ncbi:carboxypeptidase regulatory-like domain-containing protein [Longimicrobium sp.]|uniref:carboxypeptidase regulatory-like domain-containing protein n=1 Tax=Longimicrobium sp. TaxID=2029185 RepID=UPI002ED82FCD